MLFRSTLGTWQGGELPEQIHVTWYTSNGRPNLSIFDYTGPHQSSSSSRNNLYNTTGAPK